MTGFKNVNEKKIQLTIKNILHIPALYPVTHFDCFLNPFCVASHVPSLLFDDDVHFCYSKNVNPSLKHKYACH